MSITKQMSRQGSHGSAGDYQADEQAGGLSLPPPEYLPDPGIELMSLMSPASAGGFFTTRATGEAHRRHSQRNKCLSLNGAIGKKRISSMRALSVT